MSKRNYLSVVSTGVVAFGTLALGLVSVLPVASAANAAANANADGTCKEGFVKGADGIDCVEQNENDKLAAQLNKIVEAGNKAIADYNKADGEYNTAKNTLVKFAEDAKQTEAAKKIKDDHTANFAALVAMVDQTKFGKDAKDDLTKLTTKGTDAEKARGTANEAYTKALGELKTFVDTNCSKSAQKEYEKAAKGNAEKHDLGATFGKLAEIARADRGFTVTPPKNPVKPVNPVAGPQKPGEQTKTPEAGKQPKVKKGHHKFGAPNTGYEF